MSPHDVSPNRGSDVPPFDNVSLRGCVPWASHPLEDVSLGRRVPDRYVPNLDLIEVLNLLDKIY